MTTSCCEIHSLEELRQYVTEILCEYNQLQVGAFQMTERILVRGGKPCGIYFCLNGPRATKFSAIWETDSNRILFYGSGGQRFQNIQLTDAPRLDCVAA
jgi:hypothetical protein